MAQSDQSSRHRRSPRVRELENALNGLLDALDRQRFPPGSGPLMRYSMAVDDAMQAARDVLPPAKVEKADPRDIATVLDEGHR